MTSPGHPESLCQKHEPDSDLEQVDLLSWASLSPRVRVRVQQQRDWGPSTYLGLQPLPLHQELSTALGHGCQPLHQPVADVGSNSKAIAPGQGRREAATSHPLCHLCLLMGHMFQADSLTAGPASGRGPGKRAINGHLHSHMKLMTSAPAQSLSSRKGCLCPGCWLRAGCRGVGISSLLNLEGERQTLGQPHHLGSKALK